MGYRVGVSDTGDDDIRRIEDWLRDTRPQLLNQWLEDLIEALRSLESMPMRCPLAREAELAGFPMRCLVFGKRNDQYRILFEVRQQRGMVMVVHIRHARMRELGE